MMLHELIIGGVGIVTTGVSSWLTYIFAKRKYNSEVDQTLIGNMEKSLEFYSKLADDNSARLDGIMKENAELRKELQDLRKQMLDLTLNICMNLTCKNRVREEQLLKRKSTKVKERFNESKSSKQKTIEIEEDNKSD